MDGEEKGEEEAANGDGAAKGGGSADQGGTGTPVRGGTPVQTDEEVLSAKKTQRQVYELLKGSGGMFTNSTERTRSGARRSLT
jgi:hypothetical protein